MTHWISTLVLVVLAYGLWQRHNPMRHIPAMLTAFATDLTLVVYIETSRHAVEQVASDAFHPGAHALLLFHATISLITVLLYAVMTFTGFKVVTEQREYLVLHRRLAKVFIVLRLVNYVTSFMV